MNIGVTSPQVLVRKGLCALLSQVEGFRIVLDLDHPLDNVELLRKSRPDILLVEAANPAADLATVSQLRTLLPDTKVLLLSDHADEDYQLRAIRQGARGFVPKTSDPAMLERALKLVVRGEIWVGRPVVRHIFAKFAHLETPNGHHAGLTRREQEIMALLADGRRNKEMASVLGISENTIRAHLAALYKKIGASSRLEAALYYFERVSSATRNGLGAGAGPSGGERPSAAARKPERVKP